MDKLTAPVFSGMAPAGNCACQLVKCGTQTVVDIACTAHERWRDSRITDAVLAERAACANAVRGVMWELERDGLAHPSWEHLKDAAAAIEARTDAADEEGDGDGH